MTRGAGDPSAGETGGAAGAGRAGVAADVLRLLAESDQTLAVAESLTGGLVAAELTEVPGASRSFRGSVTAYATELKDRVLGVDAELLAAHGAVNAQVAEEMAAGVRRVLGATWGDRHHRSGRSGPAGRAAGGHGFHRRRRSGEQEKRPGCG
ncbi:hypothetical protein GCM10020254_26170 [Streptomyces goshikiensis]